MPQSVSEEWATREGEARLALAALRAPQWWHFLVLPAASVVIPGESWTIVIGRGVLAVLSAAACLAYAYGLNAVTDRDSDESAAKNPLARRAQVPESVLVALFLCLLAAVGCALPLGAWSAGAAALSLAFGSVYSAGPRWKAIPGLSLVGNAGIFVPLLALGGRAEAPPPTALVIAFALLLTQNQLVHELADRAEDLAGGLRTTAGALGATAARGVACGLGVAGALVMLLLDRDALHLASAIALLGAGALCLGFRTDPKRARRLHRIASAVAGLVLFVLAVWGRSA